MSESDEEPCILEESDGEGHEDGPIFFFGTKGEYGFLSNFYFRRMSVANGTSKEILHFPTVEHFMHYQKAMMFGDKTAAKAILAAPTPNRAKRIGRQVKNFKQDQWDNNGRKVNNFNQEQCDTNSVKIVLNGLAFKFAYPDLAKQLLATGDRELVEASPYDRIWGIGYAEKDAMANRANWGENLLGKCLMAIRRNLASSGEPGPIDNSLS